MNAVRPLQIASGRHPFEIAVLITAVACGVTLVVTDTRPASVTAAMPAPVQTLWEVGLVVSGVVGLVGVTWTGALATSMGVELIGMVLLGTVTCMYAVALYVVSGTAAIAAGAFVCGIAAAAWVRAAQVLMDLRRVGRAAEAGSVADVTLLVEKDHP